MQSCLFAVVFAPLGSAASCHLFGCGGSFLLPSTISSLYQLPNIIIIITMVVPLPQVPQVPLPHNHKNNSKSKSMIYAVASGPNPGIYFSWHERSSASASASTACTSTSTSCTSAHDAVRGQPLPQFQSCSSVAEAERYLSARGLLAVAPAAVGWISTTSRAPIRYEYEYKNRPLKKRRAEMAATATQSPLPKSSSTILILQPQTVLDACQQRAVDAAREQQNVFLTGVAGTGKSLVTKLIYEEALERYQNTTTTKKSVALCAPTGMAAVGLGGGNGQTVHSLAGVQVPLRASDFSSMRRPANEAKWKALECLILDEVGMLSADFIDWLDWNVRQIRHRPLEAFGGIQLIFVGDFAQLGPVPGSLSLQSKSRSNSKSKLLPSQSSSGPPYPPHQSGADCFLNIHETTAFAFQSALWREADFCHVHLTQVYRQKDRDFVNSLMDLREQRPHTERVRELVRKCETPLEDVEMRQQVFGNDEAFTKIPEGLLPTVLYTNNKNADRENAERLASLNTEHKRFEAQDSVQVDEDTVPSHVQSQVENTLQKNKFFDQCHATKHLDLKIGAQVMLVQNISTHDELVNGSRGVVEKFELVPVVRDFRGTEERLIGPDDRDLFPEGKTFEQLDFKTIFHFQDRTWKMCRKVKYPLIRFLNNKTRIILPTTMERTLFGQGTCRRKQLPLRLSWALTIHKAQGCTLDWLICDLEGCFTAGQAYVALSRAKSMAGLQIRNFSPNAVLTNPLVDAFYHALANHTVPEFLQNQAGLWWYPIYFLNQNNNSNPEKGACWWYRMFTEACSTAQAKANAQQFCYWVANYRPLDNYQGWKGYNEPRRTKIPVIHSPVPTNTNATTSSKQQQHRTVTPTGACMHPCLFPKKAAGA